MLHEILHACLDALICFPFLFLVYLFIEFIEKPENTVFQKGLSGKFAPLVASFTGVIPQCGFSVVCAKLYRKGMITLGTLFAAFISTSDEGLVVLISDGKANDAVILIAIKIVYAFIVGGIINLIFKNKLTNVSAKQPFLENEESIKGVGQADIHKDLKHADENVHDHDGHCGHDHDGAHDKAEEEIICPCCGGHQETAKGRFLLHPLIHSLKVFMFILIVNVIFAIILELSGEKLMDFLSANKYVQPIIAGLVGLIPNCSASVIIAQTYSLGAISFGGLISGLCANAGVGIAVLFKDKTKTKENLIILLTLYLLSLPIGYIGLLIL